MKGRPFVVAGIAACVMALSTAAVAQRHGGVHPNMPTYKPPPIKYPMSADNFRKLTHWYSDLFTLNQSRMSEQTRLDGSVAILRLRECTAAVTADGVVTSHEASRCMRILDQVKITTAPR